jgi:hypothetical protein
MKATLQVLFLLLGASAASAAFAGLIGINPSVAFLTSEAAFWLYPVVGLMLIGFNDYSRRPAIILASTTKARPVLAVQPGRRANAYGIRRRTRVAA